MELARVRWSAETLGGWGQKNPSANGGNNDWNFRGQSVNLMFPLFAESMRTFSVTYLNLPSFLLHRKLGTLVVQEMDFELHMFWNIWPRLFAIMLGPRWTGLQTATEILPDHLPRFNWIISFTPHPPPPAIDNQEQLLLDNGVPQHEVNWWDFW